jgi:hypothetical protein
VVDKMAGAKNLIDEIDFVTASKDPMKDLPKDMASPIEEMEGGR